ncbi:hypothetical protein [Helicobacter sp. 16-1353]|nr:hypothetical protein [Helicobacter sp. 16-1353]
MSCIAGVRESRWEKLSLAWNLGLNLPHLKLGQNLVPCWNL